MFSFKRNEFSLLVATTVTEVGIDVPDATIIIIENAEQFGLSQLHQLRGRVGRGNKPSFCVLLYDNLSKGSSSKLKIMCESQLQHCNFHTRSLTGYKPRSQAQPASTKNRREQNV
jgi:ATP-dependent DNA helicase RecG